MTPEAGFVAQLCGRAVIASKTLADAGARCSKFSGRAAVPCPLSEAEEVASPPTCHPGIYQSYPISGSFSAGAVVCSGNSA